MKPKLSAREIARKMANIMVEHVETLPVEERRKKIKAGQKVTREKGKDSGSSITNVEDDREGSRG